MSTPYQICGLNCPYWQPTGISRCEGACAITGELRMEGNGCDMLKEIEERAKLENSHQPTIVNKDHEQCH